MIDLEQLEADLDLALADELRVPRRATAAARAAPEAPPAPRRWPRSEGRSGPAPRSEGRSGPAPRSEGRSGPGRGSDTTSLPRPSAASPLAPPETVWEEMDLEQHGRSVVDLVGRGLLAEADLHIAAHAELARSGHGLDRHGDALGWTVMRALLAGRERAARAGLDDLLARGGGCDDRGPADGYWLQRLWVALTWGDEHERYALLDHCRERAWCHGDIAWRGRLTLLLAQLGRIDEAGRELDATAASLATASSSSCLDLATDLVEAAAILGDGRRRDVLDRVLMSGGTASAGTAMVVAGRAWVCKGSVSRYQALAAATAGDSGEADRCFRVAAEAHRRIGADTLLARTLDEWGRSLAVQDPQRSAHLLWESAELHRRLDLSPAGADQVDLAS